MNTRSSLSRPRRTSPGTTAGTILIAALEERHRNFVLQLARVRKRPGEPGVHDLRVATRRLIAVVDLVSSVVEVPSLVKQRKVLRRFLKGCNVLRDVHIRKLALARLQPGYPVAAMVLRQTRTQEGALLTGMGRSIRAFDAGGVQVAVGEVEEALLKIGMNSALVSATRSMLMGRLAETFSRVVRRKDLLSAADPASIHRMRVAFKKLRYTLEIMAPLLPWVTAEMRKRMNAYQTAMGKVQDTVVVLDGVAAFERTHPVTGRMALVGVRQLLLRRQRRLIEEFLTDAENVNAFWR